jgi:hypothetical protein
VHDDDVAIAGLDERFIGRAAGRAGAAVGGHHDAVLKLPGLLHDALAAFWQKHAATAGGAPP